MVTVLKSGVSETQALENSKQVRDVVERILSDVSERGDQAVREFSVKFDSWAPERFRLSEDDIDDG